MTDWGNPESRLALIDAVGAEEYARRLRAHRERSIVATGGRAIRTVQSRWGQLFHIDGTSTAFATLAEASAQSSEIGRQLLSFSAACQRRVQVSGAFPLPIAAAIGSSWQACTHRCRVPDRLSCLSSSAWEYDG